MNLDTKQKQTQRPRKQMYEHQRGRQGWDTLGVLD